MEGQRVHEYTVEVGPDGMPHARLGKVHNLITFIREGSEKVHYLDGRWVNDGGREVPETLVSDVMRQTVADLPFDPTRNMDPDVIQNCEFCDESMPSREYARHLVEAHIRTPRQQQLTNDNTSGVDWVVPTPVSRETIDPTPRATIAGRSVSGSGKRSE